MSETQAAGERLQKALAAAGVASRRAAEELIVAGRVTVNGKVVAELGTRVLATDALAVDGKSINRTPRYSYIVLNKPTGVLSTAKDSHGRRTVLDLVSRPDRVYPVGRLDLDSEGLLLLTNDGDLTFHILHPKHELEREYEAWITPPPTDEQLDKLRRGVDLNGWVTSPARIRRRAGGTLGIIIHEGHKRQVRLMCQAVGLRVVRLVRIRLGPLLLGTLKSGESRELRPAELAELRRIALGAGLPDPPPPRQSVGAPARPTRRKET
jgi:23S rRNA pseudouridine2605 synthase